MFTLIKGEFLNFENMTARVGEVAQWLQIPSALAEDPSLGPTTHIAVHSHYYSSFRVSSILL